MEYLGGGSALDLVISVCDLHKSVCVRACMWRVCMLMCMQVCLKVCILF